MRRLFIVFVLVLGPAAVYACSEATDGLLPPSPPQEEDGGSATDDDEPEADPESSSGRPGKVDAATVSKSVVLLNEISGSGEWIEIVNSGTSSVDISGWHVADRDKDTGEPKLEDAITLPAKTKLAAGAYAVVKGGGIDGGKPCPEGGQAFCIHAEFGISNKNGETIFLLLPDGGVAGSAVYPPDAAASGDSWGRIPSGDEKGDFQLNAATPGAENTAK